MLGQIVFHLLSAAHASRAPWPVVVLVACMPVVTLGFGAALTRLLAADVPAADQPEPGAVPEPDPVIPEPPASLNGHGHKAAELFASDLAAGEVPGIRRIRGEMRVGQPRAQAISDYLTEVSRS